MRSTRRTRDSRVLIDSDADGIRDADEVANGTNSTNADTDGDGLSDGYEVAHGLNPLVNQLAAALAPLGPHENGLTAAYFHDYADVTTAGISKRSSPNEVKKQNDINFINSYYGVAAGSSKVNNVAASFTGWLYVPESGSVDFELVADDGVRLYLDGYSSPVIDFDGLHGAAAKTGSKFLTAGIHQIRVDYFEAGGNHSCHLTWTAPGRPGKEIIPSAYLYRSNAAHTAIASTADWDQDGLTDLAEIVAGTDKLKADTDGDGLKDGEEVLGTYGYATNPLLVDTDGDSISDYDEAVLFRSNGAVADISGFSSFYVKNGEDYSSAIGTWVKLNGAALCGERRGSLIFDAATPAGAHLLEIDISEHCPLNTLTSQAVFVHIDGEYVARVRGNMVNNASHLRFMTPWLAAGNHQIQVTWDNTDVNTNCSIDKVELKQILGPDADNEANSLARTWASSNLKIEMESLR